MIGLEQVVRRLKAVEDRVASVPGLLQGEVTAVDPGPPVRVTVDVGTGPVTAVRVLESYVVPQVGDGVWVLDLGRGRMIVLGQLQSAAGVIRPFTVGAQDAEDEGGELTLAGTDEYPGDWRIDNYQGAWRVHKDGTVPIRVEPSEKGVIVATRLVVPASNGVQFGSTVGSDDALVFTEGNNTYELKADGATTDSILRAGRIEVVATQGIRFGHGSDDSVTFDDSTNTYSLSADGSVASSILRAGRFETNGSVYFGHGNSDERISLGTDTIEVYAGGSRTAFFAAQGALSLDGSANTEGAQLNLIGPANTYAIDVASGTLRIFRASSPAMVMMQLAPSGSNTDMRVFALPELGGGTDLVVVAASSQVGRKPPSSARFKTAIEQYGAPAERIVPVRFRYRPGVLANDPDGLVEHVSFLADSVAAVLPEGVTFDAEGQPYGLRAEPLIAYLAARLYALEDHVYAKEAA